MHCHLWQLQLPHIDHRFELWVQFWPMHLPGTIISALSLLGYFDMTTMIGATWLEQGWLKNFGFPLGSKKVNKLNGGPSGCHFLPCWPSLALLRYASISFGALHRQCYWAHLLIHGIEGGLSGLGSLGLGAPTNPKRYQKSSRKTNPPNPPTPTLIFDVF